MKNLLLKLVYRISISALTIVGCYGDTIGNNLITPQDPNIRYIGRWDKRTPGNYHSYWSNAYFRTGFTGTTVKIKLSKPTEMAAFIDGKPVKCPRCPNR